MHTTLQTPVSRTYVSRSKRATICSEHTYHTQRFCEYYKVAGSDHYWRVASTLYAVALPYTSDVFRSKQLLAAALRAAQSS
jgi:hypothetical protein